MISVKLQIHNLVNVTRICRSTVYELNSINNENILDYYACRALSFKI